MSKYNALQLKVQRRFASGLASMLSYTYSQCDRHEQRLVHASRTGSAGRGAVQNY